MSLRPRRGGFTLVEMLVVIALIIILLSLLIVGLNLATRTAQTSNTRSLMQSIRQALTRFKEDVGFYPPVLNDARVLWESPLPGASGYAQDIQGWYSRTALAEFLVGYGPHTVDGYGDPAVGEVPATGIRTPGRDGVWGAGPNGLFTERNPVLTGQVFGPYFELGDERLIGCLDLEGKVRLPGEQGYEEPRDDGTFAKVICDYWGRPIRYYRRAYPPGALNQSYRPVVSASGETARVPTLSDVIVLRPWSIEVGGGTNVPIELADARGDVSSDARLDAAEFALFSPGPDREFEPTYRVDDDDLNKDNIVEVGP
jgi:prepilin-type N-terminal cleavage/methylation domain-containing protein